MKSAYLTHSHPRFDFWHPCHALSPIRNVSCVQITTKPEHFQVCHQNNLEGPSWDRIGARFWHNICPQTLLGVNPETTKGDPNLHPPKRCFPFSFKLIKIADHQNLNFQASRDDMLAQQNLRTTVDFIRTSLKTVLWLWFSFSVSQTAEHRGRRCVVFAYSMFPIIELWKLPVRKCPWLNGSPFMGLQS